METLTVPVISTAHISRADAELLEQYAAASPQTVYVARDEYSFWLYADEGSTEPGFAEHLGAQFQLSASVAKVMAWAHKRSFHFVRLDRDGEIDSEAVASGELDEHHW